MKKKGIKGAENSPGSGGGAECRLLSALVFLEAAEPEQAYWVLTRDQRRKRLEFCQCVPLLQKTTAARPRFRKTFY